MPGKFQIRILPAASTATLLSWRAFGSQAVKKMTSSPTISRCCPGDTPRHLHPGSAGATAGVAALDAGVLQAVQQLGESGGQVGVGALKLPDGFFEPADLPVGATQGLFMTGTLQQVMDV